MRPSAVGSGQRYRPSALLSEDRLGTLWRGTDARSGSTVTIRLVDERLTTDPKALNQATMRLRWAQLDSTDVHLAKVVDYALRLGGPPAFVVSEGSDGETLAQHLSRGERLSVPRALEVISAIADGLASAHRASIHHGTLTSASVLFDGRAVAKVVDIGLGELLDDGDGRGRPARVARLDREATDVLAVARLCEELLFGGLAPAGVRGEVTSGPMISTELSQLVLGALSPYRLQRPSMAELALALASAYEASLSGSTGPDSRLSQRERPRSAVPGTRRRLHSPGHADMPATVKRGQPAERDRAERVDGSSTSPAAHVAGPLPTAEEPPSIAAARTLVEPPAVERPTAEGATRPRRSLRLARPRPRVVLGASVVVLAFILGLVTLRAIEAGRVEDLVRPTVTPPLTSTPPSPEAIEPATVPIVLGRPLADAIDLIEGAGLVAGSVITVPGEEGVVIQTDPTQGEALPAGTVVAIFVGSGAD